MSWPAWIALAFVLFAWNVVRLSMRRAKRRRERLTDSEQILKEILEVSITARGNGATHVHMGINLWAYVVTGYVQRRHSRKLQMPDLPLNGLGVRIEGLWLVVDFKNKWTFQCR